MSTRPQLWPRGANQKSHTEAEWSSLRPVISDMYAKGKTQKEIMQALAKRGTPVTLAQLKRRVKDWGLRRKVNKDEYVTYLRQHRDIIQAGGTVPFIMRDRRVGNHKIARALQRFGRDIDGDALSRDPSDDSGSDSYSAMTPESSAHSMISSPSSTDGSPAPTSMLVDSERFLATFDEADETGEVPPTPCLVKYGGRRALASLTEHEASMKRIQRMQLLSNAFCRSFGAADHQEQKRICLQMWTSAVECYDQSLPKETEIQQTVVAQWLPKLLPNNHPWLVASLGLLAAACSEQAKYIEAEAYHIERLERARSIHGPEAPETLVSQNHLGTHFMHTGRLDLANENAKAAYDAQCRTIGEKALESLYTYMTIGGIAFRNREYDKAAGILKRVQTEFTKQLGPNGIFTFRAEQELARCHFESGDLQGSKLLYTDSVTRQWEALGVDHHETVSGMVRLARVLLKLEEHEEAEELLRHAVDTFEWRNGEADPVTLRAKLMLAEAYSGQRKLKETLEIQQEVLAANEDRLHKCPWILKGMAESALRYHHNFGMKPQALAMQHLVVRMSEEQREPADETRKHRINLQLMQEG